MPGKRYTAEEKQKKLKIIRDVYENGGSVQKAGQAAGVAHQTARIWMKEAGVNLRETRGRKEIEYDPEDLRKLAERGLSEGEIGKAMHVSKSTAGMWLKEHGIEINLEARKARKEEERRNRPEGEKKSVKKCRTCIYRSSSSNYGCNYIGVTGQSRLLICTVAGCTVYRKGKRITKTRMPEDI